jgi:hypothetical protein
MGYNVGMSERRYKKASSRIAKRRKARRYFGLFLKIGLPVAFVVGLIFLLRADFLQIKNFEVLGAETISQESIKNTASSFISGTRFFVIPKSNILLLSKNKLAAALLSKFGRLQKVEVNKEFFSGSIKLSVSERKADFLWCSAEDECFFMSKDGLVFQKSDFTGSAFLLSSASKAEPTHKIIFRGVLEVNPLMKNFTTPEKMQNYSNFVEVLKSAGFEIISVDIESADKAVAKSNIGDIVFDPDEADLASVAQNVILLINEVKGKNHSAQFNYIDARFGNKVFYKLY